MVSTKTKAEVPKMHQCKNMTQISVLAKNASMA